MIIRSLVILSILLPVGLYANAQSREKQEPTISECAAKGGECDETRGRPVCGTDDQTYPSRCHLIRVQCSGHQVSLKYRGPCKACKEAREYAVKHKSKSPPKFIPRCKPDGTYAPIQCLGDSGCWCSDNTGKPYENTSVRTGKPNCREFRAANKRHLSLTRVRRTCTQLDRAAFNMNLIKVFQSEYMRSGQLQLQQRALASGVTGGAAAGGATALGAASRSMLAATIAASSVDQTVLDWKFAYLDVNANEVLDKNEFRELKKLVKRVVKPRRCGRAFGKLCDANDDDRLTRVEWNNCLTMNDTSGAHPIVGNTNGPGGHGYAHQNNKNQNHHNNNNNNHHNLLSNRHDTHTNNNNNNHNRNQHQNPHIIKNVHHSTLDDLRLDSENTSEDAESSQRLDYEDDGDYETEEGADEDSHSIVNTIHYLRLESPLKESDGDSDCLADQATALEEQRHGNPMYVPECTPDGRYQRVQCYRPTPYCWCVHEDTGKHIPGTSVKDKRPQCDPIYPQSRPMKGCPEPKKAEFLRGLKDFLKNELLTNTNAGANTTKWNSEDERIATLSFVLLDKNKNKLWERKEWKTFRELMTNSKTLRKCGKKMPRYCDVNADKKITLTEWLNCLEAQRLVFQMPSTVQAGESSPTKSSKLTGSNPLEQYLKD